MYSSGKVIKETLMNMEQKLIPVKTKKDKFNEDVKFWLRMFHPRTKKFYVTQYEKIKVESLIHSKHLNKLQHRMKLLNKY